MPVIRRATQQDKIRCITLLRESHSAAGFTYPFQAAYASALFDSHISHPHACVIVVEHDGVVQGLIMATWFEHPFGAGRYAKETVWYVSECARGRGSIKMLDAYEQWARDQDCDVIGMASLSTNDVSKLYERKGYAPAETHFVKNLK